MLKDRSRSRRAVPFFDYRRLFAAKESRLLEVTRDVIRRGAFVLQSDVYEFEERLAKYLGVRHAVGVGNATDALTLALRGAGLRLGDEVILPSHTMVASAAAIVSAGGRPVPVECGWDHMIDPESIRDAISPRTRAIMPVHLNGRTADMDAVVSIAAKHKLMIVEDAAQALGARYRGRCAGSFGVAGGLSFYPAKTLGCLGDGGAVLTNDGALAEKVRLNRDHGRAEHGAVVTWGQNSRLDNLQAAILTELLKDYEESVTIRRSLARMYDERLSDLGELTLPPGPDECGVHFDIFQNYEVEADRREDLRRVLKEDGIGTAVPWGGKAVHQVEALGCGAKLPFTERVFSRCLMLPMNTMLSGDDVEYVCAKVRRFYRG